MKEVSILGRTTDLGTSFGIIETTATVIQTAAQSVEVVSSSVEDGAGTHTGLLKVMVEGVDANFAAVSEEATLNGTTAVAMTQTFLYVNHMYTTGLDTANTTGAAIGKITLRVASAGADMAHIEAGYNVSMSSRYVVPANSLLVLDNVSFASSEPGEFKIDISGRGGVQDGTIDGTDVLRTILQIRPDFVNGFPIYFSKNMARDDGRRIVEKNRIDVLGIEQAVGTQIATVSLFGRLYSTA